jgi:hypothetical protein
MIHYFATMHKLAQEVKCNKLTSSIVDGTGEIVRVDFNGSAVFQIKGADGLVLCYKASDRSLLSPQDVGSYWFDATC